MPLPDNFSPWQHLFEQLTISHNPIVERSFTGIQFGDISSTLGGMYTACIIQPDDTAEIVSIRLFLYYFVYKGNLPTPVYGIPIPDYQANFQFHPQIQLHFREDWSPALQQNGLTRATAQISFRLMKYSAQTITQGYLRELAQEIKVQFGEGTGFVFEKGVIKYSYTDYANGFQMRLLVESEGIGNLIVEKIVSLVGASFSENHVSVSQSRKNFPTIPPTTEILGKPRKTPRLRPITQVRFIRAEAHIYGVNKPIVLIDKTGRYDGLVT